MPDQAWQLPPAAGKGAILAWEASFVLFCPFIAPSGEEGITSSAWQRSARIAPAPATKDGMTMKRFKRNKFTLSEEGWGRQALFDSSRISVGIRAAQWCWQYDGTVVTFPSSLQLMFPLTLHNPEHKVTPRGNHRRVAAERHERTGEQGLEDAQILEIWVRACRRVPAGTF